jgi:hypothetical protein
MKRKGMRGHLFRRSVIASLFGMAWKTGGPQERHELVKMKAKRGGRPVPHID